MQLQGSQKSATSMYMLVTHCYFTGMQLQYSAQSLRRNFTEAAVYCCYTLYSSSNTSKEM